jgi:hypothetical protein
MLVRHVAISHFRGIESLDWHVNGRLVCLVGPGDSTKTTILDAVELALAPRWYVPFADADFFKAESTQSISIAVTVGELPNELLTDDKCGLCLRGYRCAEPINDDPDDGWEPVVTVRLRVHDDLEPRWELVKENISEPKPLSWRDRECLGMARLGNDVERHLTWSRGSALARITEKQGSTRPTLALANRAANAAIAAADLDDLQTAAKRAQEAAKEFGVNTSPLKPGLDTQSISFGVSALSLHDERQVPLRAMGLGTRRLTGLAIQKAGLGAGAVLLIDEVEYGLEPHRIRRLLKKLNEDRQLQQKEGKHDGSGQGQVLMTTHSPTAIMALPVINLRFVMSQNGVTTVKEVASTAADAIQGIVRKLGHTLLARKIIVCEGKTEEALCRILDDGWAASHGGETFAFLGIVAASGEGRTAAPHAAAEFRRVGYEVAFFGDSDEPIQPNREFLEQLGVKVVLWEGGMSTEERIATDLPLVFLQSIIDAAVALKGEASVLDSIGSKLQRNLSGVGRSINTWLLESDESAIRSAIGKTAKDKDWFKDLNAGNTLAQIAVKALPKIPESDFAKSVKSLEVWVYG